MVKKQPPVADDTTPSALSLSHDDLDAIKRREERDKQAQAFLSWITKGSAALLKRFEADLAVLVKPEYSAPELASTFGMLRDAKDALEAAWKRLDGQISELATKLIPEAFERDKIQTFTTTNGYRVTVSERYVASMKVDAKATLFQFVDATDPAKVYAEFLDRKKAEQWFAAPENKKLSNSVQMVGRDLFGKEVGMQWLRLNNLESVIQETVNAGTLSAAGKAMLQDGQELPEDFFNCTFLPNTSLTKTKPAKKSKG